VIDQGKDPDPAVALEPPAQPVTPPVTAPTEPRRGPIRFVALVGAVMVAILGYSAIQYRLSWDPDGWRTTSTRGVSISLPRNFDVITDVDSFVRANGGEDPFGGALSMLPDLFVLSAEERIPASQDPPASALILKLPRLGTPEETARDWTIGAESDGYGVGDPIETQVGVDSVTAFRLEGRIPSLPPQHTVVYVVDGDAEMWLVSFSTLPNEYERLAPVFDRSIASLDLP
jgi:hypothetical protein